MKVEKLVVGSLWTNCYLIWDEKESVGVVIDPGGDAELIISEIRCAVWQPLFIFLTHGHADHIAAVSQLKEKFPDAKVVIHKLDAPMLGSDTESLGILMGIHYESIHTDKVVENGNVISVSPNLSFQVLHTPGHTLGGVCFLVGNILFSGDTLFRNGIGRTDLPGGDFEEIEKSLRKLSKLPGNTLVYPGHVEETRIGDELRNYS